MGLGPSERRASGNGLGKHFWDQSWQDGSLRSLQRLSDLLTQRTLGLAAQRLPRAWVFQEQVLSDWDPTLTSYWNQKSSSSSESVTDSSAQTRALLDSAFSRSWGQRGSRAFLFNKHSVMKHIPCVIRLLPHVWWPHLRCTGLELSSCKSVLGVFQHAASVEALWGSMSG